MMHLLVTLHSKSDRLLKPGDGLEEASTLSLRLLIGEHSQAKLRKAYYKRS